MREIAVCVGFMNDKYRRTVSEAAEKLGFSVSCYDSEAALAEEIGRHEVIFGHPSPELLRKAESLRWLCSDFAGVEKYLPEEVWPHPGCLLSNASGAYGPTISEHIIMVLLMLLRRMPEYQAALSRREWPYFAPIRSITGSHAVLLGTGDIGSNTARRLKALGARVTGVCRGGKAEEPAFDRVLPLAELESVLPEADALILALPATAETAGVLSGERLALLPETAFVINVGRGSAIDQDALVEALQSGRLAGAALDVMTPEPLPEDHPLWSCPNTIITPHVSGNMSLGLTCDLDVEMFCRDLARYAKGEMPEHLVDRVRGY
ncbi:MAG: D-2-hydroxyacid dehydrogenase [Oscillibacter sp.]|nr:D-2-hydroxyacid dehydrogenase [Oscillibacter sp.]